MKTYLKNRTQEAKLFLIDENYILGFLVGEFNGSKIIKKLNGKIINIFIGNNVIINTVKNDESLSDCEVTDTKTNYGHLKQYKYKDGRTVTIPNIRI
jgi:hypothetical protein